MSVGVFLLAGGIRGILDSHSLDSRSLSNVEETQPVTPEHALLQKVTVSGSALTAANLTDEEAEKLPLLFPDVQKLTFTGTVPTPAAMKQLQSDLPKAELCWTVQLGGKDYPNTTRELDLSGIEVTLEQLQNLLPYLPELKTVNGQDSALQESDFRALQAAAPDCFFLRDIELAGTSFSSDSEFIDLSDIPISDVSAIEEALPFFPRLKTVEMCRCGVDNETMDALNRRHEDVRFIWTVQIKHWELRTDIKWFYPWKNNGQTYYDVFVNDEDLIPLRYCTDIEAIDIGHNSGVSNCEFVRYMPNLKYLIIIETSITDISPISTLKNLIFLEIFTTKITDYSPLIECTALEDLNLGLTYGDPTPLTQMTWLKNIWWYGVDGLQNPVCGNAKAILTKALPNTRMKFDLLNPNVDNGWRGLQNYKDMRILMDNCPIFT